MRRTLLAMAALAGLLAAGSGNVAEAVDLPGPLVTVDWLELNQDGVVLLDVRKKTVAYEQEGHIPGAILVDWKQVRADLEEGGVVYEKM